MYDVLQKEDVIFEVLRYRGETEINGYAVMADYNANTTLGAATYDKDEGMLEYDIRKMMPNDIDPGYYVIQGFKAEIIPPSHPDWQDDIRMTNDNIRPATIEEADKWLSKHTIYV